MKPDLIISWPRNADYPVWRQMIKDNRLMFNNVIITFTETHQGDNYIEFVKEAMFKDFVQFIVSRPLNSGEDWRNVAVNEGLFHSLHSEWLWFTEQDFIPKEGFWDFVKRNEDADVICVKDQERIHPCCIFIKRTTLNNLSKNFGIVPNELDHFGIIQREIEAKGYKITVIPSNLYHHMNGLSHNLSLMVAGGDPNYHPDEFNDYLVDSLLVKVPLSPGYRAIVERYLTKIGR